MKPFARDPFSLINFHRVLIGVAITACAGYGIWEITRGSSGAVPRAAVAWILAILLTIYLWRIRFKKL